MSASMEKKLTNSQLEALWSVVVETGEDGKKGYIDRDCSFLFKMSPDGEVVRDVLFQNACGAIVHKTSAGRIDGRLYKTKAALKKAWAATDDKTGAPPWKK